MTQKMDIFSKNRVVLSDRRESKNPFPVFQGRRNAVGASSHPRTDRGRGELDEKKSVDNAVTGEKLFISLAKFVENS